VLSPCARKQAGGKNAWCLPTKLLRTAGKRSFILQVGYLEDIMANFSESDIREAFQTFDRDGNGFIGASDIHNTYLAMNENLNDDEVILSPDSALFASFFRFSDDAGRSTSSSEWSIRMVMAKSAMRSSAKWFKISTKKLGVSERH
jgi:hypothetical protein